MEKLNRNILDLSPEKIRSHLGNPENFDIYVLDTVDSTNSYAKNLAQNGAKNNTVVIANHQTAGRGRLGRTFYSPAQTGLYMSILLCPEGGILEPAALTIAAAVAVCRSISTLCDKKPQIKWVNDIFVDGKKTCGILAEAGTDSGMLSYIIIGIGLNISTEVFPGELKSVAGSLNTTVNRSIIAGEIINQLNTLRPLCGTQTLIDEYKSLSLVLGKKISFTQKGETHHGTAIDINIEGNLIVRLDTQETIILKSGEISLGSHNFI